MVWNPGDDTDLNEGGAGTDTVEVNGGNGAEQFTTTANGTRVRFDRLNPAPFSIDIGTSEKLVLNANGGDDSFSATGNLAALIGITVDGGAGNDTLLGSNGIDMLLGGDGNDFVDGQQGNDVAFLGAGDDMFQWDPGDGSDVVEGQDGTDAMTFNGSAANENLEVSANGGRVRFTRNIAAITMDLNDVESIVAKALGGADNIVVNDLSGTDVTSVTPTSPPSAAATTPQPDNVIANATNGDDVVSVSGDRPERPVLGLAARVTLSGAIAGSDRVTVNALAGDDVVDATSLAADSALLDGQRRRRRRRAPGRCRQRHPPRRRRRRRAPRRARRRHPRRWARRQRRHPEPRRGGAPLAEVTHARTVNGKTVLKVDGKERKLPRAGLAKLAS